MDARLQLQIGIGDNVYSLGRGFGFGLAGRGDAGRAHRDGERLDGDLKTLLEATSRAHLGQVLVLSTSEVFGWSKIWNRVCWQVAIRDGVSSSWSEGACAMTWLLEDFRNEGGLWVYGSMGLWVYGSMGSREVE